MSLMQFSNTADGDGIIETIEDLTGTQSATDSSYSLKKKTRDVNLALGNYMMLAIKAAGRWQVDDTNQTDYPIMTGDIHANQQDYSFITDQNGNQVLDIYKVRCKDSNGNWSTLTQRDLQDGTDTPINSTTQTSSPTKYDLTANGIFLTDIPKYEMPGGLEVFIARTPSYFASTDTDKKAGIPDFFQEYLTIRPSYFYCLEHGLPQKQDYHDRLYGEDGRGGMEYAIAQYHSNRNRDEKRRIVANVENNK